MLEHLPTENKTKSRFLFLYRAWYLKMRKRNKVINMFQCPWLPFLRGCSVNHLVMPMRHEKMLIEYIKANNINISSVRTALTGTQLVPEQIKLDIIHHLNAIPYVSLHKTESKSLIARIPLFLWWDVSKKYAIDLSFLCFGISIEVFPITMSTCCMLLKHSCMTYIRMLT